METDEESEDVKLICCGISVFPKELERAEILISTDVKEKQFQELRNIFTINRLSSHPFKGGMKGGILDVK